MGLRWSFLNDKTLKWYGDHCLRIFKNCSVDNGLSSIFNTLKVLHFEAALTKSSKYDVGIRIPSITRLESLVDLGSVEFKILNK